MDATAGAPDGGVSPGRSAGKRTAAYGAAVGRVSSIGTALNHELPEAATAASPPPKGRSVTALPGRVRPYTASSIGDMVGGGGSALVAATGARVGRTYKARGEMNPGVDGHAQVSNTTASGEVRAGRPVPRREGDSVAATLHGMALLGRAPPPPPPGVGSSVDSIGVRRGSVNPDATLASRRHASSSFGRSTVVLG